MNSSASGFVSDSFERVGDSAFTDVEIIYASEVNFLATGKRYGRRWMLKGLRTNDELSRQRLCKEFELMMRLQHPNVVMAVSLEPVDDLGTCIVMEYVEGITLKEWLATKPTKSERRRIADQLVDVVCDIHSLQIVHRDLKPTNIMVTSNGNTLKLIDFGLADTDSYTILKQPAGSSGYISPEQLTIARADVRNDIYSLGVILSDLNIGCKSITRRCLLPIDRRYQTAHELKSAIARQRKINKSGVITATLLVITTLTISTILFANKFNTIEHKNEAIAVQLDTLMQKNNDLMQKQSEYERSQAIYEAKQSEYQQKQSELEGMQTDYAQKQSELDRIQSEYEKLQAEQKRKKEYIEGLIAKGHKKVDKAVKECQIWEALDTAKRYKYVQEYYTSAVVSINAVPWEYAKTLPKDITETERSEILNALTVYVGEIGAKIGNKIKTLR